MDRFQDCHINVETCCDIRAVKYLYKYVHKGHDKVLFRIAPENSNSVVDEIANFQNARWVSPVEAAWRIYGFPLHGMFPAVLQLQVHLPNFQTMQFEDDANLQQILQDERLKRTMLTEFFRINATDHDANQLNLLYKEFPRYYVWHTQFKTWTSRKKGVVIGRLCVVNPVENERYYLKILLNNVRCPKSYDDLLIFHGVLSNTFQEAAYRRSLLHNDDDAEKTMEEEAIYKMPVELRRLFATLLHYCRPSNPQKIFNTFYHHLAEDFKKIQGHLKFSEDDIMARVLQGINDTLESLGRNINEFHLVPFKYAASESERYTRELMEERNIPVLDEDLHAINLLNKEQKNAFDTIFNNAMSDNGGVYFVDGPGGTGKSFLYKIGSMINHTSYDLDIYSSNT
ncbi:hypothetical protein LIER_34783 [Lithospermum erythrorhizon]|uniref:ATP-dependent DNA helicase n=1 Tax=Lithospermum erythrorhizon TaxID=34254 RepID=A0AAV3S2S4_LITER